MPYQNEHAARVVDPGKFEPDSFRRKEITDGVSIILGKLKGESSMSAQAYRFDKTKFTSAEAKKWLKDNNIKYIDFEPAETIEEKSMDMSTAISRSFFNCGAIEIRESVGEKKFNMLSGYAIEWNTTSVQFPGTELREVVRRNAFDKSLSSNTVPIKALWNHNLGMVLGSTKNGTLRLKPDERGLIFEIDLPDTTWGRDAAVSVGRRDVDTMSFSFIPRRYGVNWTRENGLNVRELLDVELLEISPCPFAAYQQTSVYARSIMDDYEQFLQITNEEISKNKKFLDLKMEIIKKREQFTI